MKEMAVEIATMLIMKNAFSTKHTNTDKKNIKNSHITSPWLPQDTKLGTDKTAPTYNPWQGRTIGNNSNQNKTVQNLAKDLQKIGATDIRINQQQVNAKGHHVGINRPDLQYTLNGKRYYVEYDTKSSKRGPEHKKKDFS